MISDKGSTVMAFDRTICLYCYAMENVNPNVELQITLYRTTKCLYLSKFKAFADDIIL